VGLALALVAGFPGAAEARSDAEGLVRVLSPTRGQGVFASGQVVKVVVRRGARLTVQINGRNVTGALRLRTVRRGRRTRTLRGRLPHRLVRRASKVVAFSVRARAGKRRDADAVLVQAVVRRPGFMRLRLRRGGPRAPVEAIVRTRTHRIWLRAKLNGRRIEGVSRPRRIGERRLRLTRTEGLRPGRNVLEIAANSARGRGDVERRAFRLSPSAVIPGVRALDHVRANAPVRLDAGPSLAPRSGRRLTYRWRFASRPRGSHARLRGATRRVARFRPDVPGRYSVRLVARPAGRRGAAATAAATGAGSLVTDVTAQAPIPPYGLQLSTDPSKGVTYNGSTFPMPSPSAGGMVVVPISAESGMVGQNATVPGTIDNGIPGSRDVQSLLDALDPIDSPANIVVVVGAAGSGDQRYDQISALGGLAGYFRTFGLDSDAASDLATAVADGEPFALVGQPGSVPGSGVISASPDSSSSGVLDGRLRLTGVTAQLTGVLVFEQPDYRWFQLGGGTGPTQVSEIDAPAGTQPTNWIDQPTEGGTIQVTIIDAINLTTAGRANVGWDCEDGTNIAGIENVLEPALDDPSKLVLFKMSAGTACQGDQIDLANLSHMLASLGANRDIFLRSLSYQRNPNPVYTNPGTDYVFFGGAGVEPVEGSSLITADGSDGDPVAVSSPTMSGILRKNNRGQWAPAAAATSEQLTNALRALATRAPVAYGYPTNVVAGTRAQYAAAEGRLFELLLDADVVCAPGPDCTTVPGVRVNYANQELLANLATAQTELDCKPDGTTDGTLAPDPGAIYTQAQLNALQAQVCSELKDLMDVHGKLFAQLNNPESGNLGVYNTLAQDSTLDLLSASDAYLGFLEDERDKELADQKNILGISGESSAVLGDLFTAGADVAGFLLAPETGGASIFVAQAAGDAFTLGADTVGLASSIKGAGESADKVAPTLVTVGNLFTYIQQSYGYATARMNEVEAIITSDPTKLADAAAQVNGGTWDLEQNVSKSASAHTKAEAITFQLRMSALQYMLPRMLSVAAKPCDFGGDTDDPTVYVAWTRIDEEGSGPYYLSPSPHRLRSVHLDSSDAQTLASHLFDPPFAAADPIAAGPSSAALPRSPFFMWQVAPTTISRSSSCSEDYATWP
jgi:hypothetical protein